MTKDRDKSLFAFFLQNNPIFQQGQKVFHPYIFRYKCFFLPLQSNNLHCYFNKSNIHFFIKITLVGKKITSIEVNINLIGNKIIPVEDKINLVGSNINSVEKKMNPVGDKMKSIEKKMN